MAASDLSVLVRQLHHLTREGDSEGVPDAELLRRYLQGDAAGFELLIWRHGAMIFGVCRRLLGDHHDAEDAFQAVFLTLARKARSIRQGVCLPAWLHTIANRIALRILAERRLALAALEAVTLPDPALSPAATAEQKELGAILDAEVNRLPEKLRIAFILCHLQEKTCAEAARDLGCPTGTVASRLARACERLRQCLARRGVSLSAGGLLVTVPAGLTASTTRAAMRLLAGQSLAGLVSSRVLSLSRQNSSRIAGVCLAALTVLLAGLGGLTAVLAGGAPPPIAESAIALAPIRDREVDGALIQGLWRPVRGEENGKALSDPEVRSTRLLFDGKRVVWRTHRDRREGRFTLQPGKPSLIQVTLKSGKSEETELHGICELKGEYLRICLGSAFDPPKSFSTRPPQGQNAVQQFYELRRAPIDSTPEVRSFLERVQQYTHGGTIDPKALPALDPVTPWGSLLLSQTTADDALLKHMEGLKQVSVLRIDRTKVTDKGLASLAGVSELESLSLDHLPITDVGLKHLAGLTELRELSLHDCRKVTDAGLKHLRGLKKLVMLTLGGTSITSAGLAELSGLKEMISLVLTNTAVDDDGLAALAKMKQLRAVYLGGTRVKGTGMKALRDLPDLQALTLDRTPITDDGLKEIAKVRALRHLILSNTPTTDAGLAGLSGLKQLRSLSLNGTRVTGSGLKSLAGLSEMQWLVLDSTPLTDDGLDELAKVKSLRYLTLKNCSQITPAAITRLKQALPDCEIVLR